MILVYECVVICVLFSLGIFIPLYKNPIGQIMSYPKKIRARVESLPEYKECIKQKEQKHIVIKIMAVFVFAIILGIIAYLSGAKNFIEVFKHVFIIFFTVNMFDLLIMDLLIFRNVKKFRIPGTEDMDKEYKECWHHIRGAFFGIGIGLIVACLSAIFIQIIT